VATQDLASGQVTIYGEEVKFSPRRLLDGKISVIMPDEWTFMAPEIAKIKYPYEARPPVILTDETTSINFALNHLPPALKPEELIMFRNAMKNFTQRMTKAKFIDKGMLEAENKGVNKSWFDFTTAGIDAEIYSLMAFTVLNQRALIISFNCLSEVQERWKPIAFAMLKTLTINEPEISQYARRVGVR
jgi:hypothetical protein